jgi:hypothetical protein
MMAYQSKRDWMKQRIGNELARNAYAPTDNVSRFLADKPTKPNKPLGDVFGKLTKELASLNKSINQNIHASESGKKKGPTKSQIQKAADDGRTLYATQPSTAFTEVSWTSGVCTFSFAHKTVGDWDVEMTLDDFLDLSAEPSLGVAFNRDWYGA